MRDRASAPALALFNEALARLGQPPVEEHPLFVFDAFASDAYESVYWLRGDGLPPYAFMLSSMFQVGLHECGELIAVGEAHLAAPSGVVDSTLDVLTSAVEVTYARRTKRMWVRILDGSGHAGKTSVWVGLGRWEPERRGMTLAYPPTFDPNALG